MIPSRLSFWFFPAWSGDFRLEATGDTCVLTVEDPSDEDRLKLIPFLVEARKRGWTTADGGAIAHKGESVIEIASSLRDAGPVLAGSTHGDAATWTAVRHVGGTVVIDGVKVPGEATAAATVTPPRKGCPPPSAAERRASEVLRVFSTERQMRTWSEEGWMRVVGSHTGEAYRLYHRDEAAKRGLPRLLIRAATGAPVCVWDDRVPPAEEALAIKLAVEHREAWLLDIAAA